MTHASLFNGIGGFQLAAQWAGWDNIMSCEIDRFCNQVTKYHFPNCIQHGDIKQTDFAIYKGRIDILTGGFPCQPYSSAGKRLGKEDERHLWPEMLRAIREIQPTWVVGENVRGLTNWNGGLVFDEVQADLEALGYEATPYILPACAVNAPHRRDRVWFIAYTQTQRERSRIKGKRDERWRKQLEITEARGYCDNNDEAGTFANTNCQRRCKRWVYKKRRKAAKRYPRTRYSRYGRATWQKFPTQSPVCSGNDGIPTKLDVITFSKWRNESIKAYGNAIVPQVAYQIFKAINEYQMAPAPDNR